MHLLVYIYRIASLYIFVLHNVKYTCAIKLKFQNFLYKLNYYPKDEKIYNHFFCYCYYLRFN